MRIVLAGDSHLAYLDEELARLGPDVLNVAVGGSVARHLSGQLATAAITVEDVVVVSIGTNDTAPLAPVPLTEFASDLDTALAGVARPRRWVYLAPPGIRPGGEGGLGRDNATILAYADVARARFDVSVDSPALLTPLGAAAFEDDGVHLTAAAYDVLLPALREACRPAP